MCKKGKKSITVWLSGRLLCVRVFYAPPCTGRFQSPLVVGLNNILSKSKSISGKREMNTLSANQIQKMSSEKPYGKKERQAKEQLFGYTGNAAEE